MTQINLKAKPGEYLWTLHSHKASQFKVEYIMTHYSAEELGIKYFGKIIGGEHDSKTIGIEHAFVFNTKDELKASL